MPESGLCQGLLYLEKAGHLKFPGCPGWASGNFYKVEVSGKGLLDLTPTGSVYKEEALKERPTKPEHVLVRIYHSSGKPFQTVEVKVTGLASTEFLGEDKNGNFYVQVEKEEENGIELEVHKFGPAGDQLGVLTVPYPKEGLSIWRNKLFLLGKDGVIWQVLPTNDGWRINRWSI